MLHLTAKSTQFGKKTFTSWLIEAAGTVPMERRKDFADGVANNDAAMAKLTEVRALVSFGEIFLTSCRPWRWAVPCVCSRRVRVGITLLLLLSRQEVRALDRLRVYTSHLCAVARIVSGMLSRNRSNDEFEISILTCSITYM
jgi:glycerol-3-phosphate O-acyltransferase/dihydroxyacetone phosphate acyltransferase